MWRHRYLVLDTSFCDFHLLVTKDIMLSLFHNPTLVLLELPRGDSSLKDLIEFLQRPRLGLRNEEIEPDYADEIRRRPYVRVLWTLFTLAAALKQFCIQTHPIQILWVDEIWRAKPNQPRQKIPERIRTAHGRSTEPRTDHLRRQW